jgi:hypothetical protein
MADKPSGSDTIAARGEELYERSIRPKVEADETNIGKMIVIDTKSGDYEIDESGLAASRRLRARHPDAEPYALRVGYDAVYGFGIAPRRTKT